MINDVKQILEKKSISQSDLEILKNYEPNEGKNLLYSFFTPIWLCEVMYSLAIKYGFDKDKGKILEPACGTGNILEVLDNPQNCTAFELDETNYQIAKLRSPKTEIYNTYFEKAFLQPPKYRSKITKGVTWLKDYPFDLAIGNPPYGKYSGLYKTHFSNLKAQQFEIFFMMTCAKLLKKDGLIVFLIPSGFLRNSYTSQKSKITKDLELIDAYRMPDNIFKGTKVPTDIILLRKK